MALFRQRGAPFLVFSPPPTSPTICPPPPPDRARSRAMQCHCAHTEKTPTAAACCTVLVNADEAFSCQCLPCAEPTQPRRPCCRVLGWLTDPASVSPVSLSVLCQCHVRCAVLYATLCQVQSLYRAALPGFVVSVYACVATLASCGALEPARARPDVRPCSVSIPERQAPVSVFSHDLPSGPSPLLSASGETDAGPAPLQVTSGAWRLPCSGSLHANDGVFDHDHEYENVINIMLMNMLLFVGVCCLYSCC